MCGASASHDIQNFATSLSRHRIDQALMHLRDTRSIKVSESRDATLTERLDRDYARARSGTRRRLVKTKQATPMNDQMAIDVGSGTTLLTLPLRA